MKTILFEKYAVIIQRFAYALCFTSGILVVGVVTYIVLQRSEKPSSVTTTTFDRDLPQKSRLPRNGTICSKCDVFNNDVKDTMYDSFVFLDDGTKMCCISSHTEIQNLLFEMIAEEGNHDLQISIKDKRHHWLEQPFAAHLYIDRNRSILAASDQGDFRLRLRNPDYHRTSFVNQLAVHEHDGTVNISTVGSEGLYFIYSAITYDFTQVPVPPLSLHQISRTNIFGKDHSIQKLKFGGSYSTPRRKTSFLCGTVTLGRNEKVFVKTMTVNANQDGYTQKYIHDGLYSNYFGLFKL